MNSVYPSAPTAAPVTPAVNNDTNVVDTGASASASDRPQVDAGACASAAIPRAQFSLFARAPSRKKKTCVKQGPRLGTRLRGQLGPAYEKRGRAMAYLSLTYSPKAEVDVAFSGMAAFHNFLHCESDPDIAKVHYVPHELLSDLGVTSVALKRNGRVLQMRVIQSGDDAKPAPPQLEAYAEQYRLLARTMRLAYDEVEILACTGRELIEGHEVRLRNWFSLLTWVNQARFHSLAPMQAAFGAVLRDRGQLRFTEAMQMARDHQHSPALFLAAGIRGVATGQWRANFDTVVFGTQSTFIVGEQA